MGKVYFVGAGPFDASLLTRQGYEILQKADCVLYDHLLDEELLCITKGERIYVGKQAGHHSMPQEEINERLVDCAKRYACVVRLKGGDSFVFGRGGEEGLALAKHNIPFTFVPGVTSAVAALEMAGIPITHRGMAVGFQVLTAHRQNHELQIPVGQLEDPAITTVFLMGLSRIKEICALLRQAQRAETTPMAVIMQGCSPKQKVICATLGTIEETMRCVPLAFPGIIVVGEVVTLREQLSFYEKQPLYGRNILVAKAQKECSPLTLLCRSQGAKVTEVQTQELHYIHGIDINAYLQDCRQIVFTSRHGVHGFFKNIQDAHKDARILMGKSIYAVGEKTAQVLSQYGICADHIADGNSTSLAALLQEEKEGILLHVRGKSGISLCELLPSKTIRECIVYEQKHLEIPVLDTKEYDALCFSCASSVKALQGHITERVCVSIGPMTSKALQEACVKRILESRQASYEAMCEILCQEVGRCIEEED